MGSLIGWCVGKLFSLIKCFELIIFLLRSRGISPHSVWSAGRDVKKVVPLHVFSALYCTESSNFVIVGFAESYTSLP